MLFIESLINKMRSKVALTGESRALLLFQISPRLAHSVTIRRPKLCYGEVSASEHVRKSAMSDTILVAYATRAGSTAGVAEAIGAALAERGAQVEVRSMQEVSDLSPYRAVVAGSAIQDRQWLPEAMQWLRQHQAELARRPFASFMVCMTMSMKNPQYREGVKDWLAPVRALARPLSEGYFAGALDLAKVPSRRKRLMFRLSILLGVWSEGDHRDWAAIRAWANDLAAKLRA